MSSPHRVASATKRAANASASERTASVGQFQDDPIAAQRLLAQMRVQVGGVWQLICVWRRRHRDRAILRSLTPRQIRDFCPSEAEAEAEMSKPFWRE